MAEAPEGIEIPASLVRLRLLDSDADVERWFAIAARHDTEPPSTNQRTPEELRDALTRRTHGEDLWFAARDGDELGGSIITVGDADTGGTMLGIFVSDDPGEPVLGDAIALAEQRARALGVPRVHTYLKLPSPMPAVFEGRHGFHEHERWLRFELDVTAAGTELPTPPDGLQLVTLASRRDLVPAAYSTWMASFDDMPGDFPRPHSTVEQWLARLDGPTTGLDLVLLLVDGDDVIAVGQLQRESERSLDGYVGFLGVARARRGMGYAQLVKRAFGPLAAAAGLTKLTATTHETNAVTIHLNRAADWLEADPHVVLEKRLE